MAGIRNSKTPRPVRVFLSHSDVDMVAARKLRNLLVYRENAEVFTADDLNAGEDWLSKLREMLTSADVVVALLTPDSVRSNFVFARNRRSLGSRKANLPGDHEE
jgi:predicted nucleotide-binding protein